MHQHGGTWNLALAMCPEVLLLTSPHVQILSISCDMNYARGGLQYERDGDARRKLALKP